MFTGTAGQSLFLFTDAKPNMDPFADGYPDVVMTILDAGRRAQSSKNTQPWLKSASMPATWRGRR